MKPAAHTHRVPESLSYGFEAQGLCLASRAADESQLGLLEHKSFYLRRKKMANNKKPDNKAMQQIGMWMAIGAGAGTAIGVAIDNIAIGIGIGVAIGLMIGAIISSRKA